MEKLHAPCSPVIPCCDSHWLKTCDHVVLNWERMLFCLMQTRSSSVLLSCVSQDLDLTSWKQSECQCTLTVATSYLWPVSARTHLYSSSSVMSLYSLSNSTWWQIRLAVKKTLGDGALCWKHCRCFTDKNKHFQASLDVKNHCHWCAEKCYLLI